MFNNCIVRPFTYIDYKILELLKKKASLWHKLLTENGISPDSWHVWVKQDGNALLPIVELDIGGEEIQYVLVYNKDEYYNLVVVDSLYIKYNNKNNCVLRESVAKTQLNYTLQAADSIIMQYEKRLKTKSELAYTD